MVGRARGHSVALTSKNPNYPARFAVPDDKVEWDVDFPSYSPIEFVMPKVLANSHERKEGGYADADEPPAAAVLKKRGSHELQAVGAPWSFDKANGRPLNPRGRTGLTNRGSLGKWGPNHAGDAIVTRYNHALPDAPLEFVAVRRRDTGEWAIPGGMVDAGEVAREALRREFCEEVAADFDQQRRTRLLLDELFGDANGRVLYRGYVDDPRNTDNAWMETVAMHFHVPERIANSLPLRGAENEVLDVRWLAISDEHADYRALYASHKQIVDLVLHTYPQTLRGGAADGAAGAPAPSVTYLSRMHSAGPPSAADSWARQHFHAPLDGAPDGAAASATPLAAPRAATRLALGAGSGPTPYTLYDESEGEASEEAGAQMLFGSPTRGAASPRAKHVSSRIVSTRFQLNSSGGASQLAALGATPFWKQWTGVNLDALAPAISPTNCALTSTDLLDIFDISKPQLRVVLTVLDKLAVAERAGERARGVRTCSSLLTSLLLLR